MLRERQQKYPENIQWNFDNLVLGSLTRAERAQLGNVRLPNYDKIRVNNSGICAFVCCLCRILTK